MATKVGLKLAIAAVAGATILTFSFAPASAFTLSGPSLQTPIASAQIEKAWWRHWGPGWGWHRGWGWGWRRPWGWGYHCWRGYWGYVHCN